MTGSPDGPAAVIDLSVGQVLDPVPARVRAAAAVALEGPGAAGYAPGVGTDALRGAVARHYGRRTGRAADAADVVVVPGARAGLFAAVSACARGREVLVPTPHWSHYPRLVDLAGARPILVPGDPEDGWLVDLVTVERMRTADTAVLLLNTPVNPTGATYVPSRLAALRAWSASTGVRVIHDDTYWAYADVDTLRYGLGAGDVVVGGVSKTHALAGLRLGWVWSPPGITAGVRDVVEHAVGPTCTVSQVAARAALDGSAAGIGARTRRLSANLALAVQAFGSVPLARPLAARSGIYLCLDVSELLARAPWGVTDDVALCTALTERCGVRFRPGSTFGLPGHVRLCVAVPGDLLRTAAARLAASLSDVDG